MNVPPAGNRFTLAQLLIVVGILGAGLGLAVRWMQQAREAACRSACKNNLKQHALGFQNHQDQRGDNVPLAVFSRGFSWAELSRPYLESRGNFRSRYELPYDSPSNASELRYLSNYPYLYCPSRRKAPQLTAGFAAGDYAVPSVGVVESNNSALDDTWLQAHDLSKNKGPFLLVWRTQPRFPIPTNLPGIVVSAGHYRSKTTMASWTNGASNQIVLGEKALHPRRLNTDGKGGDFTIGSWIENDYNASGCTRNGGESLARSPWDDPEGMWPRFGSWHEGVCQFAYGDGHVEVVNNYVNSSVLRQGCDRTSRARNKAPSDGREQEP
ncbi:MAG: DUF1559 domain-containing protein [Pirellulaceae bacterium]